MCIDEAEDPAAVPMVWISKWVDYSDKYGFGYQLSDDTIGVIFNDLTKLLLLVDGKYDFLYTWFLVPFYEFILIIINISRTIQYVERSGAEHYHTMDQHPPLLSKKVKLLAYFRSYMQEHLIKTGASVAPRDGDEHLRLPFLRQWFRTSRAVVMHLTSGTLQVTYLFISSLSQFHS